MSEHDDISNLFQSADSQTFFDDKGLLYDLSEYAIKQFDYMKGISKPNPHQIDLGIQWLYESKTWYLISDLLLSRLSSNQGEEDGVEISKYSSDAMIDEKIVNENAKLYELHLVKLWLQKTCQESSKHFVHNKDFSKLSFKNKSEKYVTCVHPDAESMHAKSMEQNDALYKQNMNKLIYTLLRQGSIDEIVQLLEKNDLFWKVPHFSSGPFADRKVDHQTLGTEERPRGHLNQSAFRYVCLQISNASTDPYEKAAYSFLAASSKGGSSVCNCWEDYLWIHINEHIESTKQQIMTLYPSPFMIESIVVDMPLQTQSLNDIIEVLYETHAQDEPFLLFQSFIIMKKYENLINYTLNEPNESLLRFTAYFILLLRLTGESTISEGETQVLVMYLESIYSVSETKTICYLCSYLPSDIQSRMTANYMTGRYVKSADILNGLSICENYGLDSVKIAFEATLTIFKESELMTVDTQYNETYEADESVEYCRMLDYLHYNSLSLPHLIDFTNQLVSRLLLIGEMKHASIIIKSVGVENLKDESFKTYVGLVDSLFEYNTFKQHIEQLPSNNDDAQARRLIISKIKESGVKAYKLLSEWIAMVYATSGEVKCQFSPRVVLYMVDIVETLRDVCKLGKDELADYWSKSVDMVADDNSIMSDMKSSNMLAEFVERIRKQFI